MKRKNVSMADVLVYAIVTLLVLICVYPFLNVVATSLSDKTAILAGNVTFFPIGFQLDAYEQVLGMKAIWDAMKVSVGITIVGTAVGLVLTISSAYALSRNRLRGKAVISGFMLFTMYFSGGMIPTFLVVKSLHLYDTYAALIIPSAMSVFNFILMRTFFRELPRELEEAAIIDGAGDLQILFRIILPISKPIIATIGLFYAVSYWNEYFSSLIYIQSADKYPLQLKLRQLLFANDVNQAQMLNEGMGALVLAESVKMACIVIGTLPIIVIYPWLQKYFVKGVMLGSVKG